MQGEQITEENVSQLVHTFYGKVRQDASLSPIFNAAVGENDQNWHLHLQKMVDFWSAIMLGSKRYRGSPYQKHLALLPFDLTLFNRWLALFAETANELYPSDISIRFIEKSRMIAESLRLGLEIRNKSVSDPSFTGDRS